MHRAELLDIAATPDEGEITLLRDSTGFVISADGRVLMTSRTHGSEEAMARLACHHVSSRVRPRLLVGGLGLGFTLRAALDRLPDDAEVVCAELMAAIVDWHHHGPLGPVADHPIRDPRVSLSVGDVTVMIRDLRPEDAFDAILLDVDNGPLPLTVTTNWWLYASEGLAALHRDLRPGGMLIVWSAGEDADFASRMVTAGFETEVLRVAARTGRRKRGGRGTTHVLFVGRR